MPAHRNKSILNLLIKDSNPTLSILSLDHSSPSFLLLIICLSLKLQAHKHLGVGRAEPILSPGVPGLSPRGGGLFDSSPGSLPLNLRAWAVSALCPSSLWILLSDYSAEQPPGSNPTFLYITRPSQWASPSSKLFLSHGYPHRNDRRAMIDWEQKMGGGGSYTCVYSSSTPHSRVTNSPEGLRKRFEVAPQSHFQRTKWWILPGHNDLRMG